MPAPHCHNGSCRYVQAQTEKKYFCFYEGFCDFTKDFYSKNLNVCLCLLCGNVVARLCDILRGRQLTNQNVHAKGHSLCKQCLHNLQFMKMRSFSPNLSKLARADISCQFMKTRSLCRIFYKMNGF